MPDSTSPDSSPAPGDRQPPALPKRSAPDPAASPPLPPKSGGTPWTPREVRLRSGSSVRLFSIWGRAWKLWLTDFWPLLGYCVLLNLMIGVVSQLYVTLLFLVYPVSAGCYFLLVRRVRGEKGAIDDLFDGFRRNFGDHAVINLVTVGPVVLLSGLGLLAAFVAYSVFQDEVDAQWIWGFGAGFGLAAILAGAAIGLAMSWGMLAMMICSDSGYRAGTCLKLVGRAVLRHWFKLLLFHAIFFGLSLLGLLALYVGTFFATAWGMIATAVLYEDLFGEEEKGAAFLE